MTFSVNIYRKKKVIEQSSHFPAKRFPILDKPGHYAPVEVTTGAVWCGPSVKVVALQNAPIGQKRNRDLNPVKYGGGPAPFFILFLLIGGICLLELSTRAGRIRRFGVVYCIWQCVQIFESCCALCLFGKDGRRRCLSAKK